MQLYAKLDLLFDRIFAEKNQRLIERFTLIFCMMGFIVHLLLIFGNKYGLINFSWDSVLLQDPISAIYTPFSIILVYEIYLLIFYLPRSFTTSVSKQFEIISLIIIRRIFGDIPKIKLNVNWFENEANIQLIYDLIGILLLFFLIYLFNLRREKLPKGPVKERLKRFVSSKKGVSLALLPILVITSIYSFTEWILQFFDRTLSSPISDINTVFYNEFFTILILADVFILLLSLQYTERYSQLIRNTGFVICTILIRLSFATKGLTNILLILSSVLFGLVILRIYQAIEKQH